MANYTKTEPITLKVLPKEELENIKKGLQNGTLVEESFSEDEPETFDKNFKSHTTTHKVHSNQNTSLSADYMCSIIKNILFLVLFWVGNYFVLTSVYKEKSEWTFEHIMASIGITTILAVAIVLYTFFKMFFGLIGRIVATLACLFGLAYLGDKAVEIFHLTYDVAEQGISIIGILINIITVIKLIRNIQNYRLIRYGETHGYFAEEE